MLALLYIVKGQKALNIHRGGKNGEKEIFIGWFMFNYGSDYGVDGVWESLQGKDKRFIFAERRLRNGRGIQREVVGKQYVRKCSQNFFCG